MNPEASPLLAQLQDIHSAGPPGWWPPAPGWWLLGLALVAVSAYLLRSLWRSWMVSRRRRAWLAALDELNSRHDPAEQPHEFLAGLNRLFRAVAVRAFPDTACARLQGEEWVAFLTALMPAGHAGSGLQVLASGPYEPLPDFEASRLNESARAWVKHYG